MRFAQSFAFFAQMKYKAVIFDLDGTLMDSLKDLAISVNHALACMNMPQHTIEEIKQFVGNGARRLIELSVESGSSQEQIEECFSLFRQHYACHCMDYTCLYNGIQELLENLKDNGVKLAIVSNKPQFGVTELYKSFFSSTIDVAIGEAAPLRRKPYADMVVEAMKRLGVKPEESIYVGDSDVDIMTARNANLPCISVLWGFRDKDFLTKNGATIFAEKPSDILDIVK